MNDASNATVVNTSTDNMPTTVQLALAAPRNPRRTVTLMTAQVTILAGGIAALVAGQTVLGASLLALAVVATFMTRSGWRWWTRYPGAAHLASRKRVGSLQPGSWIVCPGSQYAVALKQIPTGSPLNPTVADGITQEELLISAPVYTFSDLPKGARRS